MARFCADASKSLLQNWIDVAAQLAAWRFQGRKPVGNMMNLQKVEVLLGGAINRQAAAKWRLRQFHRIKPGRQRSWGRRMEIWLHHPAAQLAIGNDVGA